MDFIQLWEAPDPTQANELGIQEANRKKKKSGGFQSMGLSQEVWRGVMKKGYKVPTPIQRKTVPLIMDGKVHSCSLKLSRRLLVIHFLAP